MAETRAKVKYGPASNVEFIASRDGLVELMGTKLDNAQYIAAVLTRRSSPKEESLEIGSFKTPSGKRLRVTAFGLNPVTDGIKRDETGEGVFLYDGRNINGSPETIAEFLNSGRENELFSEKLAYFEVEGDASDGRYHGLFYSLADAAKMLSEKHEQGEL